MYGYNNFNNTMPTATQPYGYSMPNYQQQTPTTNMIFVSGYDDVVQRYQMPSTSVFYKHNDKDIVYIKTLDNKGQFQIKEYALVEKTHTEQPEQDKSIDLSCYAKTTDLDPILSEIKALKEQVSKFKQGGGLSGTTITRPTA